MKATLTFNLPEESAEFADAVHGGEWKSVCWQIDEELRKVIKYGDTEKNSSLHAQAWRNKLHELIEQYGLNLWD
jgi:hypothetical protein